MSFALLSKKNELLISTPTSFATNKIYKNRVHTAIGVGKNYKVKVNAQ